LYYSITTSTHNPPLWYDAIIEPALQSLAGFALRTTEFHLGQVEEMPSMASTGTHLNHQKQSMAGVQDINDCISFTGFSVIGGLF